MLLIPLLVTIISCEKENQNFENQKKEETTKVSRASFKSVAELEDAYKAYKDSPSKLKNKLSSIGFIKNKKNRCLFYKIGYIKS